MENISLYVWSAFWNFPTPNTAPPRLPAHWAPFNTPFAKVSVPEKFYRTQGVEAKVFATQSWLYTISKTQMFTKDNIQLVFALFYLTRVERNWVKPMAYQLFEGVSTK